MLVVCHDIRQAGFFRNAPDPGGFHPAFLDPLSRYRNGSRITG